MISAYVTLTPGYSMERLVTLIQLVYHLPLDIFDMLIGLDEYSVKYKIIKFGAISSYASCNWLWGLKISTSLTQQ